jgi:Fe-S-cluster containining protein
MDPALRADFIERLGRVYADMDAAYALSAAAFGFTCTGCEDSCCRTRFHHHTLVEYHGLRDGLERLPAPRRAQILARAEAAQAEFAAAEAAGAPVRAMCPLNEEGRCGLYAARPMICRLHGIPHALSLPGQPAQPGPGCRDFVRRCGHLPHRPLDRTPLYAALARLESEFQQALGLRRRFKHTIAEMLLSGTLAP